MAVDECKMRDRDLVEFPVNMAHIYYFEKDTNVPIYFSIYCSIFVESK